MIQLTTDTTTMSVDDGLVLLDGRRGKYWQLNASASSTLSMLLDGKTIDDVVADLTRITDAPAERVRRDTEELLSGLLAARLVELSS